MVSVLIPHVVPPANQEIKIKEKESRSVDLVCVIEAWPTALFNSSVKWEKETIDRLENKDSSDSSEINAVIANKTRITTNDTHITVSVTIDKASKKHNGTYICTVSQPLALDKSFDKTEKRISILIQSAPIALISFAKAIGKNRIFLNWTVTDDGNSPINMFLPQFKREDDSTFHYPEKRVDGNQMSMVVEKLKPDSNYQFKISAKNGIDTGPVTEWNQLVKTLTEDPVFTPIVEVKGNSHSTITIGWQPPSVSLLDYIHYYEVMMFQADNKTVEETIHPQNSRNLPYMATNLKTATEYFFRVRACSEYNKECGKWSEVVNGTTMDGQASAPLDVKISCMHHNVSRRNVVTVEWNAPSFPNGIVMSYQVLLDGTSYFKSETGNYVNQTFGPKAKNVDRTHETKAIYDNVPANTNFTVNVAAITRSKKPGEKAPASCTMPPTVPDAVPKALFGKYQSESYNWIFKLFLPRVTERNGRICCYRVYMIRLGKHNIEKSPEDMDVMTYEDAHNASNPSGGAYVANIVPSDQYQSDITLGSGKHIKLPRNLFSEKCRACLANIVKKHERIVAPPPEEDDEESEKVDPTEETKAEVEVKTRRRRRRHGHSEQSAPPPLNILDSTLQLNAATENVDVYDGPLDVNSNYSGFVEVISENEDLNDDKALSVFGDYFAPLSPKPPPVDNEPNDQMLMAITYLLSGLIVLVISLFFLLCLLHRYQKKHIIQGNEVVSLTDSLRLLCHGGRPNHHQHRSLNTVSKPPDLPPIQRENLPQAYIDRHKDSDYGFQHEFELLPDRFTDRTSRSGDMKENVYKNRYPDIKCYDQTRVKLATLNGMTGSDYINANFVIGYKERKKFICAQGPMDSTVNDFWRMIWEQHLEIIIMLTNLEEYNKTKCAKYWPERVSDSVQFGETTVSFESEQRYSDYLVRNIKVSSRARKTIMKIIENFLAFSSRNVTRTAMLRLPRSRLATLLNTTI